MRMLQTSSKTPKEKQNSSTKNRSRFERESYEKMKLRAPKRPGIWDCALRTTSASALDCDKGRALDPRKIEYFVRSRNILFFRYETPPQDIMRDAEVIDVFLENERGLPPENTRSILTAKLNELEAQKNRMQTMKGCNTEIKKVYVGFDISDENIEIFAACGQETSKQAQKIANAPKAIEQFLKIATSISIGNAKSAKKSRHIPSYLVDSR